MFFQKYWDSSSDSGVTSGDIVCTAYPNAITSDKPGGAGVYNSYGAGLGAITKALDVFIFILIAFYYY